MILQTLKENKQTASPIVKTITKLDDEIKEILEDEKLDQHKKILLYSHVLQQYLNTRQNMETSQKIQPITPINLERNNSQELSKPHEDKSILETISSTFKNKAKNLLRFIKNDRIKWNDNGVVSYNGETMNNSNIIDLVNDVISPRNRVQIQHSQPENWKEFAHALYALNVPKDLIGNPSRRNVSIYEKSQQHNNKAVKWESM